MDGYSIPNKCSIEVEAHVWADGEEEPYEENALELIRDYGAYKQYGFHHNGEWIEIRVYNE